MSVKIKVQSVEFQKALDRYAKETGRSMRNVVKRACVFIAKAYMVSTKPKERNKNKVNFREHKGEIIYNGKADHKDGVKSVMRDIGRVFGTYQQASIEIKQQSENAAKGFARATRHGDWSEAERILQSVGGKNSDAKLGDIGNQSHKKFRRSDKIVKFTDKKTLDAYKKKIAARVGFAKSAWAQAGAKFGRMTNIPAWIKRHKAPFSVMDHTKKVNPGAIMTSHVRYADSVLSYAEQSYAMRFARGRMITMMKEELKAKARKANLAK